MKRYFFALFFFSAFFCTGAEIISIEYFAQYDECRVEADNGTVLRYSPSQDNYCFESDTLAFSCCHFDLRRKFPDINFTSFLAPDDMFRLLSDFDPSITSCKDGVIRNSNVAGYSDYTGSLDGLPPTSDPSSATIDFVPEPLQMSALSNICDSFVGQLSVALLVSFGIVLGLWVIGYVIGVLRVRSR